MRPLRVDRFVASRVRVPAPVALQVAYDGRRFDGFARQPQKRLRTVEGALLEALVEAGAVVDPERCNFRPGSRTDRAVSARENVVCFRSLVPPERLPGAVLGRVPGLWPLAACEVPPGFDPRRAKWREYRYFLPEAELPEDVGAKEFERIMQTFVGRHDFSAFARLEPHRAPLRTVLEANVWRSSPGMLVVQVKGASFLWQQMRRMLGAALAVSRKEATLDEVRGFLTKQTPGPAPWGLASRRRLVLWQVHDPRLRFEASWVHRVRLEAHLVDGWGEAVAAAEFLQDLFPQSQAPEAGRATVRDPHARLGRRQ